MSLNNPHTRRPKVAISKCINFERCTYSGNGYNNAFIKRMENYVDFIPFCPEIEIGLPTPRETLRLVGKTDDDIKLIQPKTGKDFSNTMYEYGESLTSNLKHIDGFILKGRSPSCGIKGVKVYDTDKKGSNSRKGRGIIGGQLSDTFSSLPIEEEGRLNDYKIREHFLTKLYAMTAFNDIKRNPIIDELKTFHKQHQLLFASYNKKALRLLDGIVNSINNENLPVCFIDYERTLERLFRTSPRYTSNIKTLLDVLDEVSPNLSSEELQYVNRLIDEYGNHHIPFSVPLHVLKGHLIRFERDDLLNQRFFNPYPKDLLDVTDSGKSI